MNTTKAAPAASEQQIRANVARWRQLHGLEPKPRNQRFANPPKFVHKGDRRAS